MGVSNIPNQPIRFRDVNTISEDCDCLGQNFCQLVNKNDATQFQLSSTDQVTNGNFESNLDGWNVLEAIILTAAITNESAADECDGLVTISATGGTGPYTYSIDGGSFGASDTFSDLCAGTYTFTAKDADGNEGSLIVYVDTNITCGDYAGSDTDDLLPLNTSQLLNCLTSDFI